MTTECSIKTSTGFQVIQIKTCTKLYLKFGTTKSLYISYNCGEYKYENLLELEQPDSHGSKI